MGDVLAKQYLRKPYNGSRFLRQWTLHVGIAVILTNVLFVEIFRDAWLPHSTYLDGQNFFHGLFVTAAYCLIISSLQHAEIEAHLRLEIDHWQIASTVGGVVGVLLWIFLLPSLLPPALEKHHIATGFAAVWLGIGLAQALLLSPYYLPKLYSWVVVVTGSLSIPLIIIVRQNYRSFLMDFEVAAGFFTMTLAMGLGLLVLLERSARRFDPKPPAPSVWDEAI